MVHLGDVPQKFLAVLSKFVGLSLLMVCFFILQRLFDLDFLCTCRPGLHLNDGLFMAAPPFILTWIVILTESFYQKSCCSCCNQCCSNFCSCIGRFLIKYVCLGGVWASTALFDGDWYFCVMTNHGNSSQTGLPCRESLTYEEKLIKADYKNKSLDIGFGVICGTFLLWNVRECLPVSCTGRKWCRRCTNASCDLLYPPYYRWVYEDLLSVAVNSHLEEELKKIAEKRAKQICEEYLKIIRNHELPGQKQDGCNVTDHSGNPSANASDANNSPNGNANGNDSNAIGHPDDNLNNNPDGNATGHPDEIPSGNPDGHAIDQPDENLNGNANGNPDSNAIGHPNENLNGNNDRDDIFDTWQKISRPYFYLMNENE